MGWAQQCWSGDVGKVIPELLGWLKSKNIDPIATLDDKHRGKAVHDAHRYLTNNISCMDYGRLDTFLENRPGSPFVRKANANAYKSLKS